MRSINTAEEMVRNYRKELKNIRMMRGLTLVVFLLLLWLLREKMNVMMAAGIVVIFLLGLQFLRTSQTQQFVTFQRVMNHECDATKYVAIMEELAVDAGKERVTPSQVRLPSGKKHTLCPAFRWRSMAFTVPAALPPF